MSKKLLHLNKEMSKTYYEISKGYNQTGQQRSRKNNE